MAGPRGDRRSTGDDRRFTALVVALDDEPFSGAALDVARQLAERDGACVAVVCVFQPSIPVPPKRPGSVEHRYEERDRPAAAALQSRVKQLTRERGKPEWSVQLRVGHAPWAIADLAASSGADLIIIGHRGKNIDVARKLTRHTAHQIVLVGDVPVLCVPSERRALPSTGVAFDDTSRAAQRVIGLAHRLLGTEGRLHVLTEPASRTVLSRPELTGADLIAVPVPGDTFDVRALMSGGAADLLDHASCAVLMAPAERTNTTTERDATSYESEDMATSVSPSSRS